MEGGWYVTSRIPVHGGSAAKRAEGACTVWVGPDTVRVGRGDYCAIPLNTPHAIKAGPDGCRSLLISSPAGFAELITRAATPAHLAGSDTQIDLELFASVSAELGDQILGPPGTVPAGR